MSRVRLLWRSRPQIAARLLLSDLQSVEDLSELCRFDRAAIVAATLASIT